ncbi:uncharacterized protein LOC119339431 [Triticum dicoccoides]|uniref:uncharacterized protein LOC119339431 n=1 Tax=Triticum dicoccoides TaxID=85692 RepID=UPI0018913FAE|nr:uncharacterized protein LOC119339431 [Triticum dicoccoides]
MEGMEFFIEESGAGLVPRFDAGVVLRDLVAGAQLVEGDTNGTGDAKEDLISSVPIGLAGSRMDYEGGEDIGETVRTGREVCGSYDLGGEGMGDSCEIGDSNISSDVADQDADEEGVGVTNASQSSWTRRVRVGKAEDEREPSPSRMSALEASVRAYVDKKSGKVVNPSIGTSLILSKKDTSFTICIPGRPSECTPEKMHAGDCTGREARVQTTY